MQFYMEISMYGAELMIHIYSLKNLHMYTMYNVYDGTWSIFGKNQLLALLTYSIVFLLLVVS